ncbi:hypothetical protein ACWEHT_11740 [Streptomyces sp. NPDC004646]
MGETERPIPERLGDQHEQAQHLTRTGNGPTVDTEGELLAEAYGAPDMSGFYTGPALAAADDQDDQDAETAPEPAAEDTSDTNDSAKGGESA